jgi:hypothetical protein
MTYPYVKYLGPAHPDAAATEGMRELQSRVGDGLQVDLLWCERSDRAWVAVTDTKSGEAFSVPVRDGERALDVFHHPFAYAATHGMDTATSRPAESVTARAA